MRFTKNGLVGIGTSSPQRDLVLVSQTGLPTTMQFAGVLTGQGTTDGFLIGHSDVFGTALLMNQENRGIALGTNSLERMRITETGKVGIGVSAPQRELVVSNAFDTASIQLVSSVTGITKSDGFVIGQINNSGDVQLMNMESKEVRIGTSAQPRMIFSSDGKVGVNVPFPVTDFVVKNAAALPSVMQVVSNGTGQGPTDGLAIGHSTLTGAAFITNYESQPLSFGTSATERMRITDVGKIGFGLASSAPTYNIDAAFNTDAIFRLKGQGGIFNRALLNLDKTSAANDQAAIQYSLNDVAQWLVGTLNNNNYRIFNFISGNDALVINSTNDNVGIGTPTPTAKLEVNGQIKITGGGPAAGRVLISDAQGLASWGEDNPQKGFSAYSSSGSASVSNNSTTQVLFNTENFNDGNYYDAALSQFKVLSAGTYHFNAKINWNSFSSAGDATLAVRVNGVITEQVRQRIAISSGNMQQIISTNLKLYGGDMVDVAVIQTSGTTQSINLNALESSFSGFKVY